MENQKEAKIIGFPELISYECCTKIIKQMEKCICKIEIDQDKGTGFFCNLPFPDKNKTLPVLITNNHIINANILYKNNIEIEITVGAENDNRRINLNNRIKYTSEKYDTTIIEIKDKDNINNFLELDDKITNDINNNNLDYIDKTIYIIQYPKGNLSVSYGILDNIIEDKKYDFIHKCHTEGGSSGSPILNLENNRIIGIHKKGNLNKYNIGTFLNYPIKEFISLNIPYKENKNNSEMLKNLFRFTYFKKELFYQSNSSTIFEGFIIKNEIINILKQRYNIFEIMKFLENNNMLKGISFKNINSFYPSINNYLNNSKPAYMASIKQFEIRDNFSLIGNHGIFYPKYINNNINLKYIDKFEIIDKEFASFLSKIFNNHIDLLPINFVFKDGKIILAIKLKQNYIYEISSVNNSDDIIFENLIEINNNINYNFNDYLFKIIFDKGVKKLITNIVTKVDKSIIIIHSMSEGTIFVDYDGQRYEMLFSYEKTFGELRRYFFTKINKLDLIGKQNVFFMKDKSIILKNEEMISNYYNKNDKLNLISIVRSLKKEIIFETSSQNRISLFVEIDKSIKDIINLFLKKIHLPGQLNAYPIFIDSDIEFVLAGEYLNKKSEEPIKKYFDIYGVENLKILVLDYHRKIEPNIWE